MRKAEGGVVVESVVMCLQEKVRWESLSLPRPMISSGFQAIPHPA